MRKQNNGFTIYLSVFQFWFTFLNLPQSHTHHKYAHCFFFISRSLSVNVVPIDADGSGDGGGGSGCYYEALASPFAILLKIQFDVHLLLMEHMNSKNSRYQVCCIYCEHAWEWDCWQLLYLTMFCFVLSNMRPFFYQYREP